MQLTLSPADETKIQTIHAAQQPGYLEEVGTGAWIQWLLQRVPGASQTLWQASSTYAHAAQQARYGTSSRSVSQASVENWARHNLEQHNVFFSLAVSGVVKSSAEITGDHHAWLALALADGRGWSLHVRLLAREREAQQAALGWLGIELLYQLATSQTLSLQQLPHSLQPDLELDLWQAWQLSDYDNDLRSIELVHSGWSPLALWQPVAGKLQPVRYLDALRDQRLLLHKGAFNPVTRAHLAMVTAVLEQQSDYLPVLEITLNHLDKGAAEAQNLAHRLAMLAYQPWPVALTQAAALYTARELFQQRGQARHVDFVCGEDLYQRVFLAKYYEQLPGGLEAGLQRLFAQGTQLWVCSRQTEQASAVPQAKAYASQCQTVPLALKIASSAVREAIATGQPGWQSQLQPEVSEYIENHRLYRSKH